MTRQDKKTSEQKGLGKQPRVPQIDPFIGSSVVHAGWPKGGTGQSTGLLLPAEDKNVDGKITAIDSECKEGNLITDLARYTHEAIEDR